MNDLSKVLDELVRARVRQLRSLDDMEGKALNLPEPDRSEFLRRIEILRKDLE